MAAKGLLTLKKWGLLPDSLIILSNLVIGAFCTSFCTLKWITGDYIYIYFLRGKKKRAIQELVDENNHHNAISHSFQFIYRSQKETLILV